jgi:uncharacterized membrane protein
MNIKQLIQNFKDNLNVDWKEFTIGMIVFLVFFTAIAIGMLVSDTWKFDMVLVYFYGGGFVISAFFNLINPNNQKKNE